MSLENNTVMKKRHKRSHTVWPHLHEMPGTVSKHRIDSGAEGKGKWMMAVNEFGVSFRG